MFAFARTHPFVFGTTIACIKTAGMDVIVQKFVEERETLDKRRTLTFGTFGLLFNGIWQYGLFVKLMPRVVPNAFAFAAKPLSEKLKGTSDPVVCPTPLPILTLTHSP